MYKGKLTYPADKTNRLYYTGTMVGNKRQGFGEMVYDGPKRSDQCMKYIGEWYNDEQHGRGTDYLVGGNIMDGPV